MATAHETLTAAGYVSLHEDGDGIYKWFKQIESFDVYICDGDEDGGLGDDRTESWVCTICDDDGFIGEESFNSLQEALDFAPKFIDRLAAESSI